MFRIGDSVSLTLRRSYLVLITVTSVLMAVLAIMAVSSPARAATTATQQAIPVPIPAGQANTPGPVPGAAQPATAAACTPYVDGDYVHVTSGDASGHGWWYLGNCANQKTTVSMGIQEYWCVLTNGVCTSYFWRTEATGSAYVYPGGGSGNRANARSTCQNTRTAAWRSYVIVSLGNGASAYTAAQNLACQNLT